MKVRYWYAVGIVVAIAGGGLAIGADMGVINIGAEKYNETEVQMKIHEEINERRSQHGLSNLTWNDSLANVATYHSSEMADHRFFDHVQPDGENVTERYQRFNVGCNVPVNETFEYVSGENIAWTYYDTEVDPNYGDSITHTTNEQLARGFVNQWMNSTDHRKNVLTEEWRQQGVGLATVNVDGNLRVYATQNFC
jgi:uncharacterized protein YkwD